MSANRNSQTTLGYDYNYCELANACAKQKTGSAAQATRVGCLAALHSGGERLRRLHTIDMAIKIRAVCRCGISNEAIRAEYLTVAVFFAKPPHEEFAPLQ